GAPGSPGKKGAGSVQGRVSPAFNTKDGSNAEHQQLQARTTSGPTKQAASGLIADASFLLPSGDTHIGLHSDSSRPSTLPGQGSSSPTSPARAAAVAAGLRATPTTASHTTASAQGSPPRGRRGARSLRVAEGDENGGVGAAVAPSHTLLGLTELLPQAGLAAQLGRVGGPLDLLTLAVFRKLRAETKAAVQASLTQMLQFVVSQVQAVASEVGANLQTATAAVAKLTRKEARERRFDYALAREAWRYASPSMARQSDTVKARELAAARWDRDKLAAFITLCDALILAAMTELARTALAVAVHELFLPRRLGFFIITGHVRSIKPAGQQSRGANLASDAKEPWRGTTTSLGPDPSQGSASLPTAFNPRALSPLRPATDAPTPSSLHPLQNSSPGSPITPAAASAATPTLASSALVEHLQGPTAPVVFSPSLVELNSAVQDLSLEVMAVVAQVLTGLGSHPDLRGTLKDVLGNTYASLALTGGLGHASAKEVPQTHADTSSIPATSTFARGSGVNAHDVMGGEVGVRAAGPGFHAGAPSGPGSVLAMSTVANAGGGRPAAVLEQLRRILGTRPLFSAMQDRLQRQYAAVLRHVNLMPYVGHEAQWQLVSTHYQAGFTAGNRRPDQLHADLQVGGPHSLA
ncbi:hypothetical protein QJQ45_019322, partial [Haematococcus lacustris]